MILGKVRNCTHVDLILLNPKISFYCCCLAYAISKKSSPQQFIEGSVWQTASSNYKKNIFMYSPPLMEYLDSGTTHAFQR